MRSQRNFIHEIARLLARFVTPDVIFDTYIGFLVLFCFRKNSFLTLTMFAVTRNIFRSLNKIMFLLVETV